jgi:hypothetical protein
VDVTISQILGSVWMQGGLVAIALGSVAYDKLDVIKNAGKNLQSWVTSRKKTAVSTSPSGDCESRRLTLVGIRHKASELTDATKRSEALALCDQIDVLAKELWPEAA